MRKGSTIKKKLKEQTQNLVQVISVMVNPFLDATPKLLVLDTRDVVDESVVATVRTVEALGKKVYKAYDESVIKGRSLSIHESIKMNSLLLLRRQTPKTKSKQASQFFFF